MPSASQIISWALNHAAEEILRSLQGSESSGWEAVYDEDGNPNFPSDERELLVFISGDRKITDSRRPDQGYGLSIGYFDHDKQYFRVHGSRNMYVTHWREVPGTPPLPDDDDGAPEDSK